VCFYVNNANFLDGHSHCTRFNGYTSDLLDVNASFVQGSAIGPGMYVVNTGDLQVVTPGNSLMKYADDTYLVIPACNVDSRDKETSNVDEWSRANNLTLNHANLSRSFSATIGSDVASTHRRRYRVLCVCRRSKY